MIENKVGSLVRVEVKASSTIRENDVRGLKRLSEIAGKRLKLGVVLYDGIEPCRYQRDSGRYHFRSCGDRGF